MPTIAFFKVQNQRGQDLLDNYVRPLCQRLGARLKEAPAGANRSSALAMRMTSDLVLWDCSVEGAAHVYNALDMQAKTSRKNIMLSRTPLPRNVLTHYQCAPIHGEQFTNADLGEWLDKQLPAILKGGYSGTIYDNPALARHYWMFERPADYFLSFRGTVQRVAQEWKSRFEREQRTTLRMVPPNEYSYPTECVTQQQMWEGVARLMHEIRATQKMLIFISDDYFDSFWTSSEFLAALWMMGRDPKTGKTMIEGIDFVRDPHNTKLQTFREGFIELRVPMMEPSGMDRFVKLINNGDPFTSAPETQVPARGLAKLLARLVRGPYGYYDPEFMTRSYWHIVRVPCPTCKPRNRTPDTVAWDRHMTLSDDSPAIDYFGYFPAEPSELERRQVTCPNCHSTVRLENKRGVRTLWVPTQTTEADQTRPVIQEHKVWEVVQ